MKALTDAGVSPATVRRAVLDGLVVQLSRGTYRLADAPPAEDVDLASAMARVPRGLVCLLSAAAMHNLISESPDQIWIAIPNQQKTPKIGAPPIHFVRWVDEKAFNVGVATQIICGVDVRLTTPARTIIDMMRMSTIGEEVSHQALITYIKQGGSYPDLAEIAATLGTTKRLAGGLRIAKAIADSR